MASRESFRQAAAKILSVKRAEVRPDLLVISAAGEIDALSVRLLQHATWQDLAPVTVLDLSRVTFLGAVGMRALGQVAQRAHVEGRRLCFVIPAHPVSVVLLTFWTDARVFLYPTLAEALEANPARPD
ncbi:anti-sigma factor antagonist [Amycolatopsis balhimycina DSM 5908]|uniref:Anti-sigma factor antagonist n=1 Tax=Amycolatopsis balhimycina DSM 5908 TaxID=1081091 RepID=A0A428W3J1_AMYBA|nr:STAS domain-containing protein [Amycolatopsis balhimycina]RSM37632.1 anti-sigma factor antagonist [Amycolatopsis balhimycina DSM 5908]